MSTTTTDLAVGNQGVIAPFDPRRAALIADPFEPQNPVQMFELAKYVSNTDFAPKDFRGKPEACYIAMLYGRSLGLPALAGLQGVCVINGRPSVFGTTFWALITSHPDFEDFQEEEVTEGRGGFRLTLKRRGRTPVTKTFTMDDAKKAGLEGKAGPWSQYPINQCLWRVRHQCADSLFADALKGIAPVEVTRDYIEGEVIQREPVGTAPGSLNEVLIGQKAEKAAAATTEPKKEEFRKIETITKEQEKLWNARRKQSGWSPAEGFEFLKTLQCAKLGDIPQERFDEAMAMVWHLSPKAQVEGDEKMVREVLMKSGMTALDQYLVVKKHTDSNGVTFWNDIIEQEFEDNSDDSAEDTPTDPTLNNIFDGAK